MSAAFIIASLVFIATIALSMLALFAGAMSDNPSQNQDGWKPAVRILVSGALVSALIAGSHFLHLHW